MGRVHQSWLAEYRRSGSGLLAPGCGESMTASFARNPAMSGRDVGGIRAGVTRRPVCNETVEKCFSNHYSLEWILCYSRL